MINSSTSTDTSRQGELERISSMGTTESREDKTIKTTAAMKKAGNSRRVRRGKESHVYPVEPRVIQVIKKPRTYVNHSYRDFSSVPAEDGFEFPTEVWKMTFPEKVHHMLMQEQYQDWISWNPHGRSFSVRVPKKFEENVLPIYLGHKRYSSFLRQLANYGFRTLTRKGCELNAHYHECMLRGLPHLAKYMPKPKDARRQIPDPDCEPNFYDISTKYPLPDDPSFGKNEELERSSSQQESVISKPNFPGVAQQSTSAARQLLQQADHHHHHHHQTLARLMANPSHLGVPPVTVASLSGASLTKASAFGMPAQQQLSLPAAYSMLGGMTTVPALPPSVQSLVDQQNLAAAAALGASGSRQQMLPGSTFHPNLADLFQTQRRGPFGGI